MPENQESSIDAQSFSRLIKLLGHSKPDIWMEAERRLLGLGPAVVEPLLAAVEKEARRRGREQGIIGFIAVIALFSHLRYILRHGFSIDDIKMLLVIMMLWGLREVGPRWRRLVQLFSAVEDTRAVGPLAEALTFTHINDRSTRNVAVDALLRLLPRLKAGDASILTQQQRLCLYHAMQDKRPELTTAILQALEQIGGSEAVPFVEPLIHSKNADIREAAEECLPFLQQRAEQERLGSTLLRPSAPWTSPDTLLRPASADRGDEDSQRLLRATVAGANEDSCWKPNGV